MHLGSQLLYFLWRWPFSASAHSFASQSARGQPAFVAGNGLDGSDIFIKFWPLILSGRIRSILSVRHTDRNIDRGSSLRRGPNGIPNDREPDSRTHAKQRKVWALCAIVSIRPELATGKSRLRLQQGFSTACAPEPTSTMSKLRARLVRYFSVRVALRMP